MTAGGTTGVLVLARLDSRRLPGKALIPLQDRPLLHHVIRRARRIAGAPPVVLATTDRPVDDPLADLACSLGVGLTRGSTDDVAHRCLTAARAHGFDRFVRVCGDSPFFHHHLAGALIALHRDHRLDVATNVMPRSFPPGASVEVVATEALARALARPTNEGGPDATDREHVTRFFYRRPEGFRLKNLAAPDPARYRGVTLTVDDPEGLKRARWILDHLPLDPATADLDTVADLARRFDALASKAAHAL